jgi:Arylsulfotransferase (ASST)/Secretion system C-terminal sorting domain/Cep192 domain 4
MVFMLSAIKYRKISFLSFLILFYSILINAQSLNTNKFVYLSPVPDSKLNSKETNIIIKTDNKLDNSVAGNSSYIIVTGNKSGRHPGKIILTEEDRTLIFKPYVKFADGETVTIQLSNLKTISGDLIPNLSYSFKTSDIDINEKIRSDPEKYFEFLNADFNNFKVQSFQKANNHQSFLKKNYTVQNDTLPDDFPEITVDSINNPAPGYIFLTPFGYPTPVQSSYLIITDNYGTPVFYKRTGAAQTLDFKRQANGLLTYFQLTKYYVMDSSYNIIDSLSMQNGYLTDLHECLVLEDGHAFVMSYDRQHIRMDTIVAGGNPNALVTGLVIQELDENKNVMFQWRTWDHFKITDATYDIDLTASTIDYVHGNAIEMDNDGNLLVSFRHLDEVTKIDLQTGDIIWRLGGEYCKNNQFTFIDDSTGFSHQHDVRRLPNGNLTVFDNGNLHSPSYSRAVEYQLDEINKTATLVREYKNDPETYSVAMGSSRRLDNDNMLVGWGLNNIPPAVSENTPSGDVTLYLSIPNTMVNYRASKIPWKTNLFVTDPDTLYFGDVNISDSSEQYFDIINNSNQEIEINGLLNRDSSYKVMASLPIIIPAFGDSIIGVMFMPRVEGDHFDDLYLQWNTADERIAQVISMNGTGKPIIPVELSSFTASVSGKTVKLNWTTATETNTLKFEIERKSNGANWKTIGFVKEHGTTTEPTTYSFTDNNSEEGTYFYRLKQIDLNGTYNYSDGVKVNLIFPIKFSLHQNYPNPFNPTTKISFTIPEAGMVYLKIYDILGRHVKTLLNKKMSKGSHDINFNAETLANGIYVYTLRINGYFDSKKMILLK